MLWVNLRRIIRSGFFNFFRNGFISLSSVLVMLVTLFVIGSVIFMGAILNSTLEIIKDKVDIRVTFVADASEAEIAKLKDTLERLPEVDYVAYTSREEALDKFTERHRDDQLIIQALEELGDNPLGAALNIKAKDPEQYESIALFLQEKYAEPRNGSSIIDKINFFQNKAAIDKLSDIIDASERSAFIITLVLVVISTLITLNTIRLTIYISKDEIGVMKLVGAGPNYIKGPFIIGGILYGFFAALLVMLIFFPVTTWLGEATQRFFIGLSVYEYYLANFWRIAVVVFASGMFIGAVSSYLAVRRYLKY
jgi:cell division transport system permease protein